MARQARDMRGERLDELTVVARQELGERFGRLIAEVGGHSLYFVGLVVTDRHLHPMVVGNTTEALQRREGKAYAEQSVTDFEIDAWDPGQWRWLEECTAIDSLTSTIGKQHAAWAIEQPDGGRETWDSIRRTMDELFIGVLVDLDHDGVFGPCRTKGETALLYMDEESFTDDDWRAMFRRLNPTPIEQQLLSQWHLND